MPVPTPKTYALYNKDCLRIMRGMRANSVDTIITDPPYGLKFMGKDWDHGIPGIPFWEAALRVAKPGAMLMAFGGDRTHHRLMCAIEDAGWELRTTIGWVFGSGFPKSHNLGKALTKVLPSNLRCSCAPHSLHKDEGSQSDYRHERDLYDEQPLEGQDTSLDASPLPDDALLRNHADLHEDVLDKALKHTLGRSGIDHLSTEDCQDLLRLLEEHSQSHGSKLSDILKSKLLSLLKGNRKKGFRKFDRSDSVSDLASSSVSCSGSSASDVTSIYQRCSSCKGFYGRPGFGTALKPAIEFIVCAMKPLDGTFAQNALKWGVAGLWIDGCRVGTEDNLDGGAYSAEGARSPTSNLLGSTGKGYQQPSGRWPANLIHDGSEEVLEEFARQSEAMGMHGAGHKRGGQGKKTGENTSMFCGDHEGNAARFGDSGSAARFFYCAKASKRERNEGLDTSNGHPTVKPIALLEYLCKLTATPIGGLVFDPFMGSGSTGVACGRVGRRFLGCENDTEHGYFEIAQKRIEHAYAKALPKM